MSKVSLEVEPDSNGRFIAKAQELPGAYAFGSSQSEAVQEARQLALRIATGSLRCGHLGYSDRAFPNLEESSPEGIRSYSVLKSIPKLVLAGGTAALFAIGFTLLAVVMVKSLRWGGIPMFPVFLGSVGLGLSFGVWFATSVVLEKSHPLDMDRWPAFRWWFLAPVMLMFGVVDARWHAVSRRAYMMGVPRPDLVEDAIIPLVVAGVVGTLLGAAWMLRRDGVRRTRVAERFGFWQRQSSRSEIAQAQNSNERWSVRTDGGGERSVTLNDLDQLFQQGEINEATLVKGPDQSAWATLGDVLGHAGHSKTET
jgi:hypothetical protein